MYCFEKHYDPQLKSFNPLSNAQKEIKALLKLHFNAEPQRANEKILEDVKQDLSLHLLYSDEKIKEPIILFRILTDHLVLNGCRYTSDPENNKIMYGLVQCIFCDMETDKTYATRRLALSVISKTTDSITYISLTMMTDSLSVFDVLTKASSTTEKR